MPLISDPPTNRKKKKNPPTTTRIYFNKYPTTTRPKSVPNAGDQLAPLYLVLLRCLFGLTVFFRLLSMYHYMYGRTS